MNSIAARVPRKVDLSVLLGRIGSSIAFLIHHPSMVTGGLILIAMSVMAVFAAFLGTVDPTAIDPLRRLQDPSVEHWLGTDALGRDNYSRIVYGARVSLFVGVTVAALTTAVGAMIGVISGYVRWLDMVLMRVLDGLMSIPPMLLAIAMVALWRGSMLVVIIAITVAETPRMARLVRSVVLSLRAQTYIDAAIASGDSKARIIFRHILPNAVPVIIVQATFVCAAAMIVEAVLSFLGAGTPSTIPSWGNMMAEARTLWQLKPYLVFTPAVFLSLAVFSVNLVGDGLRNALDPRLSVKL